MAGARRTKSAAYIGAIVDRALEEHGAVIVTRPGREPIAIIPVEKLREIDTTTYLLASPRNRQRLLSALRRSRSGKAGRRMTIQQLREMVGVDQPPGKK